MSKIATTPKVILAGAGPGDVDLVTVKLVKYLKKADFILVDRLVNPAIINQYASASAVLVYVGKQAGKEGTTQQEINELLVDYGNRPGLTLRLKGGDVSIFGQAIDEIDTLVRHQIPFEIVPGITAASGASASLQLPLTARNLARGARFLTYHDDEQFSLHEWQNMALTSDTLAFYMSSNTLPQLVSNLKTYSTHDKPLAIVEQATTPHERVLTSSLYHFDQDLGGIAINQPALVLIGDVLNHYQGHSEKENQSIPFFKVH